MLVGRLLGDFGGAPPPGMLPLSLCMPLSLCLWEE